jgi:hypothetical protein
MRLRKIAIHITGEPRSQNICRIIVLKEIFLLIIKRFESAFN